MVPEDFENALIAEVEKLNFPALPYPDDPGGYYPENDPGEVLVRYEGRKVLARDVSGQLKTTRYFAEIVVVTRQVRGVGGAYDVLEKIHEALEGFTLDIAAGALFMEAESFLSEKDGLWQFGQKWAVTQQEACNLTDAYYDSPIGDN